MSDFIQTEATSRFLEVFDTLKEKHNLKSSAQLALLTNIARQTLNDIKNGKRNITVEFIKALVQEFNVNPFWLFTGNGNSFLDEEDIDTKEKLQKLLTENDSLKTKNIELNAKIEALKEVIESFKK